MMFMWFCGLIFHTQGTQMSDWLPDWQTERVRDEVTPLVSRMPHDLMLRFPNSCCSFNKLYHHQGIVYWQRCQPCTFVPRFTDFSYPFSEVSSQEQTRKQTLATFRRRKLPVLPHECDVGLSLRWHTSLYLSFHWPHGSSTDMNELLAFSVSNYFKGW